VNNSLEIFGLTIPEHPEINTPDVSVFKANLIKQISWLLEKDHNTLWNTLYRIDISEAKVKEIFNGIPDSSEVAVKLADLIIERYIQKIHFRRKYSQRSNESFEGFSDGGDVPATK
jgi:hypothetical protein